MGNIVLVNDENANMCICPTCPTYKKSNLTSNLFCGRGKAVEKVTTNGCICPQCSVYKNYKLNQLYYCMQENQPILNDPIKVR
jgi:hypothetical protein